MRTLASIQKITAIHPIEGADSLERADILGWHLVVRKGEFKPEDLCIYCEVDSLLPEKPEFEFLRQRCYSKSTGGFRIKTVKLRGQISQGIAFPLNIIPNLSDFTVDKDVTDIIGIKKYEPPIPVCLQGDAQGSFPGFLIKTDETRIQSIPELLNEFKNEKFYVTEKVDGTSSTFYIKDGEFGICSRNLRMKVDGNTTYAKIAQDYKIKEKLEKLNKNICIQGEIIGEGIQGNKYKLRGQKLLVFNVFDIDNNVFLSFNEFVSFCSENGFETVPILDKEFNLKNSVDEMVEYSKNNSVLYDTLREGIVLRPLIEKNWSNGRLSFKVINPEFLIKHGE